MTKETALRILDNLKQIVKGTDNTTLGDVFNHSMVNDSDLDNIDDIRDNFANVTWDSSFADARKVIEGESD